MFFVSLNCSCDPAILSVSTYIPWLNLDPHSKRPIDQHEQCWKGSQEQRPRYGWQCCWTVVRAIWALVWSTYFANTENVERRGVEGSNEKSFRPQRFHYNGLSGTSEVGNGEVSTNGVLEASGLGWDVVKVPDGLARLFHVCVFHFRNDSILDDLVGI